MFDDLGGIVWMFFELNFGTAEDCEVCVSKLSYTCKCVSHLKSKIKYNAEHVFSQELKHRYLLN